MAVRERDGKPLEEILSAAERRVFEHLKAGATDEEIAELLDLGITTVRYHIRNSVRRMEVADREALLALAEEPEPEAEGTQAAGRQTAGRGRLALPVWLLPVVVVLAVGAGFAGGIAGGWFLGDQEDPAGPAKEVAGTVAATVAAAGGADVEATGTATPPAEPPPTERPTAAATPTPMAATPVGAERGDGSPRIVFWGKVPTGFQIFVRNRTTNVVRFFERQFGVRVPGLSIHVGEDESALLDATRETLGEGWSVGLARYRDGLLFLHMDEKEAAIERLYFQAIQEHLAGKGPWGPWWLTEGAAVYAHYLYREWNGEGTVEDDLGLARWYASFEASPLSAFEGGSPADAKEFGTRPVMVASLAVGWLVEGAGEDSLVAYYRAIGESGDWETAFERTFGLPFEEVYGRFADYRAEVAGQRRTVQGRIVAPEGESLQGRTLHIGASRPGTNQTHYGVVDDSGRFEVYIPDGTYILALVCPSFVTFGWYGGESGFTRDEAEATEVVVAGGLVAGIEITLPALPEDLSGACGSGGS